MGGSMKTTLDIGSTVTVRAKAEDGTETTFTATVRIDSALELAQYRHGGILPYITRKILAGNAQAL